MFGLITKREHDAIVAKERKLAADSASCAAMYAGLYKSSRERCAQFDSENTALSLRVAYAEARLRKLEPVRDPLTKRFVAKSTRPVGEIVEGGL